MVNHVMLGPIWPTVVVVVVVRLEKSDDPLWFRLTCTVIRMIVRAGGLAKFGLRVSSDCDARSLARGVGAIAAD